MLKSKEVICETCHGFGEVCNIPLNYCHECYDCDGTGRKTIWYLENEYAKKD